MAFAFPETDEAAAEITALFDFVWPTTVALWNMRWQVEGFLKAVPNATDEDITARFVVGSGFDRADIRGVSTTSTWVEQTERFGEIVLTNAFAIYESWAARILERSNLRRFKHFDLTRVGRTPAEGLRAFINAAVADKSDLMDNAFKGSFLGHKKSYPALLDDMLKCFRYFKEMRNCQMHNGRLANSNAVDAWNGFQPISSAASLLLKEKLEHYPITLNSPVRLSLRGTVGFCEIILRMMVTVDAELSGTKMAEAIALTRLKNIPGRRLTLAADFDRRTRQLKRVCVQAGLPSPAAIAEVRDYFVLHRIVTI